MSEMPTNEEIAAGIPFEEAFKDLMDERDPNRDRPRIESEDPTEKIDKSEEITILKFPHDLNKYHMTFSFSKFRRPSQFESLKAEGPMSYIALPIPRGINETSNFDYNTIEPGIIVEGLSRAVAATGKPGVDGLVDAFSTENIATTGKTAGDVASGGLIRGALNLVPNVVSKLSAGVISSRTANDVLAGTLQIAGLADNPMAAVAFQGTKFKTHTFHWTFAPKNKAESETIRQVVYMFKREAHPELLRLDYGGFYKYPSIVFPKFLPDEARHYLYDFKACVITAVRFTPFSPQGMPNFYTSGAPLQVDLTVEMQEIELWRNGFGDGTTFGTHSVLETEYGITDGDFNDLGNIDG